MLPAWAGSYDDGKGSVIAMINIRCVIYVPREMCPKNCRNVQVYLMVVILICTHSFFLKRRISFDIFPFTYLPKTLDLYKVSDNEKIYIKQP